MFALAIVVNIAYCKKTLIVRGNVTKSNKHESLHVLIHVQHTKA